MAQGRDYYCSYCGSAYNQTAVYPRICPSCGRTKYANAVSVAVMMVPVIGRGLVVIKRKKDPGKGLWALPAGFVEIEDLLAAGVREFFEETGIQLDPAYVVPRMPRSIPSGWQILQFMEYQLAISPDIINRDFESNEVAGVSIMTRPEQPLAFPLHEWAVKNLFRW